MPADLTTQPANYTELDLEAENSERRFQVPVCPEGCHLCAHHEPFGDAAMVVWCSLHRGHVPSGATCAHWQRLPAPNQ